MAKKLGDTIKLTAEELVDLIETEGYFYELEREDLDKMMVNASRLLSDIKKTRDEIEHICTTKNEKCTIELELHAENGKLLEDFHKILQILCTEMDGNNPIQRGIFSNLEIFSKKLDKTWEESVAAVNKVKERLGI